MDLSISTGPGGKAAAAGSRAKRGFLLACVLLAAVMYVSQERSRAAADARLSVARPEMHELVSRFLAQPDDPAVVTVHKLFYDRREDVYCGEVNSRNSRGAEVKFKDGVRIFVCGPDVHG
jgi:hypothetical protein